MSESGKQAIDAVFKIEIEKAREIMKSEYDQQLRTAVGQYDQQLRTIAAKYEQQLREIRAENEKHHLALVEKFTCQKCKEFDYSLNNKYICIKCLKNFVNICKSKD